MVEYRVIRVTKPATTLEGQALHYEVERRGWFGRWRPVQMLDPESVQMRRVPPRFIPGRWKTASEALTWVDDHLPQARHSRTVVAHRMDR